MRVLRIILSLFFLSAFIAWTIFLIDKHNQLYIRNNGHVVIYYWFIVSFIWLKVSAFCIYVSFRNIIRVIRPNRNDLEFAMFKKIDIFQRIGAALVDGFFVILLYILLMLSFALILTPFYSIGIIEELYKSDNAFGNAVNDLLHIAGWYFYFITYFLYSLLFEYYKHSTPGKMASNCGIISKHLIKPRLSQLLIKNVIKFIPINEFTFYFSGITLNEIVSKVRTIELDKSNTEKYKELIKKS